MGFSQVGAAAIVAAALVAMVYQATGAVFDTEHDLQRAREAARQLDQQSLHAAVRILSVTDMGGTVDVVAENSGSTTLDADAVDVLVDGVPVLVTLRAVEGVATAVWPPLATLNLTVVAGTPAAVVVTTAAGALGFWRA